MTKNESRTERLDRCLQAVGDKPTSAAARYNLGLAYQKMGRFQAAEEAYKEALELDPMLGEAWINLGGVRLQQWDFEGCLEASLRAVELRSDLVLAHHNLGQAYLYTDNPDKLVMCAKKALKLDPEHPASHYFAAVGLLARGEAGAAERHLAKAIELGHRPTPDFLKAMEKAQQSKARQQIRMSVIAGGDAPEKPKED